MIRESNFHGRSDYSEMYKQHDRRAWSSLTVSYSLAGFHPDHRLSEPRRPHIMAWTGILGSSTRSTPSALTQVAARPTVDLAVRTFVLACLDRERPAANAWLQEVPGVKSRTVNLIIPEAREATPVLLALLNFTAEHRCGRKIISRAI